MRYSDHIKAFLITRVGEDTNMLAFIETAIHSVAKTLSYTGRRASREKLQVYQYFPAV